VSHTLEEARRLLIRARECTERANTRFENTTRLFEARECGLEDYLATMRDLLFSEGEVTVAHHRVGWLSLSPEGGQEPTAENNARVRHSDR
jgi:hypothetical protein